MTSRPIALIPRQSRGFPLENEQRAQCSAPALFFVFFLLPPVLPSFTQIVKDGHGHTRQQERSDLAGHERDGQALEDGVEEVSIQVKKGWNLSGAGGKGDSSPAPRPADILSFALRTLRYFHPGL
jgi:hypothetical protein